MLGKHLQARLAGTETKIPGEERGGDEEEAREREGEVPDHFRLRVS